MLPRGEWDLLLGRRIKAVVITAEPGWEPRRQQVQLTLDGGVVFEFFLYEGRLYGSRSSHDGTLPEVLSRIRPDLEVRVFKPTGPRPAKRRAKDARTAIAREAKRVEDRGLA